MTVISEISNIGTLIIAFSGFFLNTFMLLLMASAAPYNTDPVLITRVLCDTILAFVYTVEQLSHFILFNGFILDNWYVCQTAGFLTCVFSGLSILSMYWAPYEQYSVVVMNNASPSRKKAALGLVIFGVFVSCFVYFGGESYHLNGDLGMCWIHVEYEASTWSKITLCAVMFFYFGPLSLALYATRKVMTTLQTTTTSKQRKAISHTLQMRILKQSQVLMIIMILGYLYPVIFGILYLAKVPLSPIAYLFLTWFLVSHSVMHPMIQFVTDDRLRILALKLFVGVYANLDKDFTSTTLIHLQAVPPRTLILSKTAPIETRTEIIART